jgi:hypothetical protein
MQQLTSEAERVIANLADRYHVSQDAVKVLLFAVNQGGGSMAQFSHPELGGSGQWMRGGMTMVGDMFNYRLQGTVNGLCSELSNLLSSQQVFVPVPRPDYGSAGLGSVGGSGFEANWWPTELGSPSSSGGQNGSSYAYFPQARRLAVQSNGGAITVYDTLDHDIGGVQQQQGGGSGSQCFTSQFGTFTVDSLPIVVVGNATGHGFASSNAPTVQQPEHAPTPPSHFADGNRPTAHQADVLGTLERLGALRDKGILSEQEFQAKKAELLARL